MSLGSCWRHWPALGGHDRERSAVDVNRVGERPSVDEAKPDRVADGAAHGLCVWPRLPVDREEVRQESLHRHRREGGAALDRPLLQLDDDVGRLGGRVRWVRHDQCAREAQRSLAVRVVVRVVGEGPRLLQRELVGGAVARQDRVLGDLGRPVHLVGGDEAVPVDRGGLREVVGHDGAHAVALQELDPRPRNLLVVGVREHLGPVGDRPPHDRCREADLLRAADLAHGDRLVAAGVGIGDRIHVAGVHCSDAGNRAGRHVIRHHRARGQRDVRLGPRFNAAHVHAGHPVPASPRARAAQEDDSCDDEHQRDGHAVEPAAAPAIRGPLRSHVRHTVVEAGRRSTYDRVS